MDSMTGAMTATTGPTGATQGATPTAATVTAHPPTCRNCGRPPRGKLVRGLCPACRMFEDRHGRPRTPADMIRAAGAPRPLCANCGQAQVSGHRRLCNACRQYLRAHGYQRPAHLWAERCAVCGKPKAAGFAKGRCPTCYSYRLKHGRERPKYLVKERAPLGFCDCGSPATQVVHLRVRGRQVPFHLCDRCAAWETA